MACSAVTGQCSNLVPTTCFGAVMCLDGSYAGGTPCWTQSGSTQTQCAEDCGDVVADPAEQTIFASLKSCVEGNGCLNPSDPVANTQESTACSATACSSQLASCLAGGSFGSGSCPALASCLNGCSTTTCQKGCYQSATANSAAEYLALLGCVFDACPGLVASCVQSAQLSNGACYQENLDCQNP